MNSFFSKYLGDMFRGNRRTFTIVPIDPNTNELFLIPEFAGLIFTAKKNRSDPDSKAVFQKVNGQGIEVDSAGNVLIDVVSEDTNAINTISSLFCDLQCDDSAVGPITLWSGLLLIDIPVTRGTTPSLPINTLT